MPWVMQMLGCAGVILGIALLLWVGFWLFLVILTLAVVMFTWRHIRAFLVAKGILHPRMAEASPPSWDYPSADTSSARDATTPPPTIEGDYKRIDSE